jgi:hypothetical protein
MKKTILLLSGLVLLTLEFHAQAVFPDNETREFEDMLTPGYYLASTGDSLRIMINEFIHYCQAESFHHPLEDSTGNIPPHSTPPIGEFGAGKGPAGTSQHHAAIDLHIGNREVDVTMYAAHDGQVRIYRDAPKYRHYLSITGDVEDQTGRPLGKIVTLYAHLDLDLDSADHLYLDGQTVDQGDIVSRHLFSGTVGGPHLHFEIRYYRPGDQGDEEFYGVKGLGNPALTVPSAGSWTYGYWNPDVGYGFGNPFNHFPGFAASAVGNDPGYQIIVSPNPTTDIVTLSLDRAGRLIHLTDHADQNFFYRVIRE